ncbi:MAG: hypothetical protein ACKO3N_14220, partial [Verrucomicrobiota bacterium]
GAFVTMIDKTAYDGRLDPVAYDRIGSLLGEARARRAHFGHPPVRDVGLYFSARTRDWMGRQQPASYFQAVQGAHKACVYEHLGFGFLFDESLSLEALRQFPVVCLPHAGIVSEREADLFRRYVEEGGSLLVTGHGGQFDRLGRPLAASTLEALLGARVKRRLDGTDPWFRFGEARGEGKDLLSGLRPGWPFLVRGPATVYEPTTAQALGELLDSHRASLPNPQAYQADWPLSARQVAGPAVLVHHVGRGRVLTFAGSPDFATAGEHHLVETRKLFARAVRLLHPRPRVRIEAPANVEAVVTDDPATRTLRIHFMAYHPTPQTTPAKDRPYVLPGLIEDAPIFRAGVEFRDAVRGVKAGHPATRVRRQGRRVTLLIEDLHEVLECRY